MIVCPVCEHQQPAGEECDVCGKVFSKDVAIPVPIPTLDGLEPTALPTGSDGVSPPSAADWVEPTALAPVEGDTANGGLDLEPTRLAEPDPPSSLDMIPVDVVEPAPDWLESTPLGAPDTGMPEPFVVTCRYCRTPAQPGQVICGRCGMRLPIWTTSSEEESGRTPCPSCGVPAVPGRCPSCGGRVKAPEA